MLRLGRRYPGFGLETNYGSLDDAHLQALGLHGPIPGVHIASHQFFSDHSSALPRGKWPLPQALPPRPHRQEPPSPTPSPRPSAVRRQSPSDAMLQLPPLVKRISLALRSGAFPEDESGGSAEPRVPALAPDLPQKVAQGVRAIASDALQATARGEGGVRWGRDRKRKKKRRRRRVVDLDADDGENVIQSSSGQATRAVSSIPEPTLTNVSPCAHRRMSPTERTGTGLLCSGCCRVRSFYHFSATQVWERGPRSRICDDCRVAQGRAELKSPSQAKKAELSAAWMMRMVKAAVPQWD
eukprot:Hpha_TRINITY_DN8368_c0_g1::TRINITY_DN8368_c0_g1_i1::g.154397::m.154397